MHRQVMQATAMSASAAAIVEMAHKIFCSGIRCNNNIQQA